MNENDVSKAFDQLSLESLGILDEALSNPEASGMDLFAALLSVPDEEFEIIRPIFQETMAKAYDDPQAQMQLIKLMGQAGLSVNDIINASDEVIDQVFASGETNLSESKKDFIRFLFAAAANSIASSTINPAHIVEIPVELCRENAKLPTYSTNGAAAMDIYSPEEYTIDCGKTVIIPIGIKVAIPHGYALLIQPRSGMSARMKMRIPNSPGLIDEDYHEEIGVIVENTDIHVKDVDIYNPSDHLELVKEYGGPITIGKGERFAQLRLIEVPRIKWRQVNSLGGFKDDHGAGFGSTGVM